MRIVFVRHGEPDYAHDCLTETGRIQAIAAAERLREEGISEIWSSPLGRAAETAEAASRALGLPVRTLDFMREVRWGDRDGAEMFAGGHPWDIADELARQGTDLNDPRWRIYTEDVPALPQYFGPEAVVSNAYITQGCKVEGTVKNSVLFTNAEVAPKAQVIDSVLMPGAVVEEGAVVTRALVADGVRIGKGAVVGSADSENILLVAKRVKGVE